jgi:uncharacterized membrane protein
MMKIFEPLKNIHRFLVSQVLYPLILSSVLAMILFIARVVYTRSPDYRNLAWNLFLAWLPYGFSMTAAALERTFPRRWWLLLLPAALWLIFFPNAPYIVTDFYHLQVRYPVPLWFDIVLIAVFAWTGCFLGIVSLRTMQDLVEKYLPRWIGWIFVAFSLGLAGFGVYLGRFGRFNSWDLLFSPKSVLKEILPSVLNPLSNLTLVGFTLIFTSLLVVFYLTFTSLSNRQTE